MKKYIALLAGLMFVAAAEAKVLVISDIDDTIKVSHVLSKKRATLSAADDDSRFVGMAEIYQSLNYTQKDIEFHYVSLAPRILMAEQHMDFITENGFPVTELHTNPGVKQDPELKQKVIRKLLSEKKPELVIYFGDNGQFDAKVYNEMVNEFSSIPHVTYIREAYSKLKDSQYPTMKGQIGFVTSAEVTIDLISRGLLPAKVYAPIEGIVYSRLLLDDGNEHFGPMVFPGWQDCRDFKWVWDIKTQTDKLKVIQAAIAQKCQ